MSAPDPATVARMNDSMVIREAERLAGLNARYGTPYTAAVIMRLVEMVRSGK